MSKMSMPRRNLQLLGTTALFVAFKVEETEMSHGLAAKFVWITENTYTISEVCVLCILYTPIIERFNSGF